MKRGTVRLCQMTRPGGYRLKTQALLCFCLASALSNLPAEGFRNSPPGAFSLGRAGGRIAQVDDASAVTHNPANLVDLAHLELQLTPSVVYIHEEFESPTGQKAESKDPWKLLPNVFVAAPLEGGKIALGLGITVPYGLGNEWDTDSSAFSRPGGVWRYQAPYSAELTTMNFNPSFAIKLTDGLRLGGGLDVMWSRLTLKQFYPWFLATGNFNDPDGDIKASGDGVGIGGNLGITYEIADRHRLALTWRSSVNVDYAGDFDLSNVPSVLGGGGIQRNFESNIKFPMIISAGYGIRLTEKIRLEADIEWLQFSSFEQLPINIGEPTLGIPTSVNQNWKDTFTFGIGGDWKFAPGWALRAGYQYYQSPVPDSTFSPTIPDANQNVITLGISYSSRHHSVEAAYGLDFYETRQISGNQTPAFNGKYDITVHLISFAYRYRF